MNKIILLLFCLCCLNSKINAQASAQTKPAPTKTTPLPDIKKYILATQDNLGLYTQNLNNHSQEHDVNSIIKDIEDYLNAPASTKPKNSNDQLLTKLFNPMRHFFLTTTNKTTVAASFLYSVNPYQFCAFHDTATTLYLFAVLDGNAYNLAKTTEKKVIRTSLEQCLLPSLKALDEFTTDDLKYIGLSVYFGCKDTRDGAAKEAITPFCLTLIARLDDLRQYAAGLITAKGLLANAELYLSDEDDKAELNRVHINTD